MKFTEGSVFGDVLDIRSHCVQEGAFRLNWFHEVWRPGGTRAAVTGMVQLVCINRERRPVPIPGFQNA
jgi:acyl-CoA thioesterase FadM